MNEVSARWTAFLRKIEHTADALLTDGGAGCLALAGSHGTVAMSNAWQGVRAEILALVDKLERTWREQVGLPSRAPGSPASPC